MEPELPATGIYSWRNEYDLHHDVLSQIAMQALQSVLGERGAEILALPMKLKEDGNPVPVIMQPAKRLYTKTEIRRIWEEVDRSVDGATSVQRTFQEVTGVRAAIKCTFTIAFPDPHFDGDNEEDRPIVAGLVTYREPNPRMRGPQVPALTLNDFHNQLLDNNGEVVLYDPSEWALARIVISTYRAIHQYAPHLKSSFDDDNDD